MKWTFWTRTQPITPDDCGTIEPLLSLYADGMASAEEAGRVERHLPDCAACRASLAWMQATRRALAARPVVSPPADLRARIAEAIAASSAAPLQVRPARAFALRPAYAAAASVAIVGLISYGLLHHPAPHTAQRITPTPPMVAIAPPVVKSVPGSSVKPPIAHHSTTAVKSDRLDPNRVARIQPDESQPEQTELKVPTEVGPAAKKTILSVPMTASAKPPAPAVKKPALPRFKPEMTAVKAPAASIETHKAPVVQPEMRKPETVVATVPPASVPVDVGTPSIKTDPLPTVTVASTHESHSQRDDLLSSVRQSVGQMRNVAYSTERKSIRGISSTTHQSGSEGMAYVPGIWTP